MRIPDESHPLTIEPNPERVVVRLGDTVVADTFWQPQSALLAPVWFWWP